MAAGCGFVAQPFHLVEENPGNQHTVVVLIVIILLLPDDPGSLFCSAPRLIQLTEPMVRQCAPIA